MVANIAGAVSSYTKAAGLPQSGLDIGSKDGQSFKAFMDAAGADFMKSQAKAEQVSQQAAVGKANLIDVMTAVNNADVTLQTISTIRDKFVSAVQDIFRTAV